MADESAGRLRVFYWDDIGYTARFALNLHGGVEFDCYRVASSNKIVDEDDPEKFIDKKERLYRRRGSLKDDFVTISEIQDAQVSLSGSVSKEGSAKYDFSEQSGLAMYYKSEKEVSNLAYLINRAYATAKGLIK